MLIIYDLSQRRHEPDAVARRARWTGSLRGRATPAGHGNLTAASDATGSINTSAIPAAESDGLGAHVGADLR